MVNFVHPDKYVPITDEKIFKQFKLYKKTYSYYKAIKIANSWNYKVFNRRWVNWISGRW